MRIPSLAVLLPVCVLTIPCAARAATVSVGAGGNLQAAIDAALPGDTILLAAGAVFTGNFTLPAKGGGAFITIRSATPDSSLPSAGTRISPSYAGLLAKVRSDHNGAAFHTAPGATYWRLQFLEILPSESTSSANLLELGSADASQSSLSAVPQHLVVDRCYIHGVDAWDQRRAIALNSGDTQILNSYVSNVKGVNEDTQAIGGWNGPGPYLIENNYLEAAGENVLFGGSDPFISGLVPSNITIRRNFMSKPLAWQTSTYTLKNLIELKNAQDVTIEGNTLENNWAAGQQGYAIVLTPRNQDGTAPWTVVQRVIVRNNVVHHVAAGFNISGWDDGHPSQQTNTILISNNLVYDVNTAYGTSTGPANGWFAVIGNGPRAVTIDHNTVDNNGNDTICLYSGTTAAGQYVSGLAITNNLLRDNAYGIFGGNSQEGSKSLAMYAPDAYVAGNTIGGATAQLYPAGNLFPTLAQWLAGFVDESGADYRLNSAATWHGSALDGTDPGVSFSTLNSAMSGSSSSPSPSPAPTSASTPFTGTPIALPGRIEFENYDKGGEGVAYHDLTAGNSGGAYRTDDVDIKATSDTSGAYNVKTVRAGEWLSYTVAIAAGGTYSLGFRIASSGTGGTVHVAIDGSDVTGPIALPDTGGWSAWRTFTANATLPAGTHVLTFFADANGSLGTVADLNWLDVTAAGPVSLSKPFLGAASALPGLIEAENYDIGGEGVAYHDTTAGNSSGAYRSDDVDIKVTSDSSGTYNVKSVRAGEWLAYTVDVAAAGTYSVDVRMASSGTGGTIHFTVDGTDVTGAIALPDTGGWALWQTVTKTGVVFPAGTHVVKLIVDSNGSGGTAADINWFRVR
jgi:Carbohydrate binding module (family 6)/Right handed beta helix region